MRCVVVMYRVPAAIQKQPTRVSPFIKILEIKNNLLNLDLSKISEQ
jgi:hypothetical protein